MYKNDEFMLLYETMAKKMATLKDKGSPGSAR